MKKLVIFLCLLLVGVFVFGEGFVETKIIFKNHDEDSLRKLLILNKRYVDVIVDGKTFYPVEVKFIKVDEGPDCIVEQITYSDVQAPLQICYYF